MSLSTHILDTAQGKPASGVALELAIQIGGTWQPLGCGATDAGGRCKNLLGEHALEAGTYRLHFSSGTYFREQGVRTLYPYVEIVFQVDDPSQHFHIPLLLTANGYTTYRGS